RLFILGLPALRRPTLFPYTTLFRSTLTLLAAPAAGRSFVNWPRYLFSAGHTSQNGSAKAITKANAAHVSLAWTFTPPKAPSGLRSEEHTSELQSQSNLVCRLLLEKK